MKKLGAALAVVALVAFILGCQGQSGIADKIKTMDKDVADLKASFGKVTTSIDEIAKKVDELAKSHEELKAKVEKMPAPKSSAPKVKEKVK
jgi:peptidoglycan hydrolase CwlO-like protein